MMCVCGHDADTHNDNGCMDCGACMEFREHQMPLTTMVPSHVDPLTGRHNPERDRQDPLTGEWH